MAASLRGCARCGSTSPRSLPRPAGCMPAPQNPASLYSLLLATDPASGSTAALPSRRHQEQCPAACEEEEWEGAPPGRVPHLGVRARPARRKKGRAPHLGVRTWPARRKKGRVPHLGVRARPARRKKGRVPHLGICTWRSSSAWAPVSSSLAPTRGIVAAAEECLALIGHPVPSVDSCSPPSPPWTSLTRSPPRIPSGVQRPPRLCGELSENRPVATSSSVRSYHLPTPSPSRLPPRVPPPPPLFLLDSRGGAPPPPPPPPLPTALTVGSAFLFTSDSSEPAPPALPPTSSSWFLHGRRGSSQTKARSAAAVQLARLWWIYAGPDLASSASDSHPRERTLLPALFDSGDCRGWIPRPRCRSPALALALALAAGAAAVSENGEERRESGQIKEVEKTCDNILLQFNQSFLY
ncbi:hypothetical protein SORBI_3006G044866 [Sorghum bicolor]|uniref:Uncharacterized protein n=1 Tax=Sorghum bicolor TaxID=4558 RepID=A0A1Z5RCX9_SORBI|nr:hypothetical protein SORBI_3006G044866 [Sorghum bicolor]